MTPRIAASLGVLALALGGGAVWAVRGGEGDSAQTQPAAARSPDLGALRARVERLEEALELERARRGELVGEVARLEQELAALAAGGEAGLRRARGEPEAAAAPRRDESHAGRGEPPPSPRFDAEVLVEAGFARSEVESFRARVDDIEMRRLYLRNQATREGWIDSPRYRQEREALARERAATRDEFGSELYDWMLYTTGHPNRVQVAQVMSGSPAAEAGFQPGDLIASYGERRIFTTRELRQGTTQGTPGETTPVDVVRDGQELRLYVPRGPLGVHLRHTAEQPPPVR